MSVAPPLEHVEASIIAPQETADRSQLFAQLSIRNLQPIRLAVYTPRGQT